MPPRFRRPEPMTTFELVPDDEREDAPGAGPDDEPHRDRRLAELRDRALARWRTLTRRGRVAVAASTAVVVVAAATAAVAPSMLETRADRLRAEAVRGLPGVVDDLSEPVDVTWTLPEETGFTAVLPGGVLAVSGADGVQAVDAATGDVVWEHPFDRGGTCGPTPWTAVEWAAPAKSVVCVEDLSRVTVLDADGAVVSEREPDLLEPVDAPGEGDPSVFSWSQVVPAAGGTVAVLDVHSSQPAIPWRPGEDDESLRRTLREAGWQDPTVRLVDAITGEERAEASLPLTAAALESCGFSEDGEGGRTVSPQPWIHATPSSTSLGLCLVTRAVTPTGAEIDLSDAARALVPLPGGRYLVQGETSEVLDASGTLLETIDGFALAPLVDTEPDGPRLVLVGAGAGGSAPSLTGLGGDGTPAWSVSVDPRTTPLARVGDTVVVMDDSAVTALDARTGDRRWRLADLLDTDVTGGESVTGVVTDGTRLLLGVSPNSVSGDGQSAPHRLVAVDLRDGSTAWQRAGTGPLWGLFSAGGHPVAVGNAVSGLGTP